MKKIILLLIIIIFYSGNTYAFVYNCKLNAHYKFIDSQWFEKEINFTISKDNDHIKIYDHEINLYYSGLIIIEKNINFITALNIIDNNNKLNLISLIINKNTRYTILTATHGSGDITIHYGYCN